MSVHLWFIFVLVCCKTLFWACHVFPVWARGSCCVWLEHCWGSLASWSWMRPRQLLTWRRMTWFKIQSAKSFHTALSSPSPTVCTASWTAPGEWHPFSTNLALVLEPVPCRILGPLVPSSGIFPPVLSGTIVINGGCYTIQNLFLAQIVKSGFTNWVECWGVLALISLLSVANFFPPPLLFCFVHGVKPTDGPGWNIIYVFSHDLILPNLNLFVVKIHKIANIIKQTNWKWHLSTQPWLL